MTNTSSKTNDSTVNEFNEEMIKPSIEEKRVSKELKNMKYKKVKLIDVINDYPNVFLDDYGIARVGRMKDVYFNSNSGEQINYYQLYKAVGDEYEYIGNLDFINFIRNENWNNETYYMRDPEKNNRYYGYGDRLQKGQEKKVKIKSLTISLNVDYLIDKNHETHGDIRLEFKNKEEIEEYTVIQVDSFSWNELIKPEILDIKKNNLYYYMGYGIGKVVKVYKYPNKDNLICDIKTKRGGIKSIDFWCSNLFYLPYDEPKSKLAFLDECNNELALMPYVIREGQTFNVYWKAIDEAADYIISLYKIIESKDRKELYHLNDYTIDRNENMFIISGLIGNTFVFKVSAEDRSGNKIAVSRGIVNGYPDYLVEEK